MGIPLTSESERIILPTDVTKIENKVSFDNFANMASLCVGFHFGTLHG